ncbi:MAG: spheroidene monooxygenase [Pseudomonadota bacterium]
MGASRLALPRVPGIGFWKLMGSGTGEGFTPRPNTAVWAILATWPDEGAARAGMDAPVFARWRNRAAAAGGEAWTIFLSPASARGHWSGSTPFDADDIAPTGPLAAITRATIRPTKLARFWNRAPAISDRIGADPNVLFKIGVGEVPFLHQVTFSIWPDTAAMHAFARNNGPHAEAIKAVREGNWFAEELYARFHILGEAGTWGGTKILTQTQKAAA